MKHKTIRIALQSTLFAMMKRLVKLKMLSCWVFSGQEMACCCSGALCPASAMVEEVLQGIPLEASNLTRGYHFLFFDDILVFYFE